MHIPAFARIGLVALAAMVVRTEADAAAPSTMVGINDHILYRTQAEHAVAFATYRDTGTRFLRVNIDWMTLEPEQGVYSKLRLENLDNFFALAEKARIRVLACIAYAPSWANGGKQGGGWPPTDNERYADFCEWILRRYSGLKNVDGDRVIDAVEIWNEPDLCDLFFKGYPRYSSDAAKAYGELVKVAGARLRAVKTELKAQDIRICAPAISNIHAVQWAPAGQKTWIDTFYSVEGVTSFYDVVTMHSYWEHAGSTGWLPPELPACWNAENQRASVMGRIYFQEPEGKSLWDRMKTAGDGAKEIWFTEIGASSRGDEPEHAERMLSMAEQKAHFADAMDVLRKGRIANLKRIYWYSLFDEPYAKREQRYYGMVGMQGSFPLNYTQSISLTEAVGAQKPVYSSYRDTPKIY